MGNYAATRPVGQFLDNVLRSGLLDRQEIDQALRLAQESHQGPFAHDKALADFLVETGRLTHFQARKILQGKTRGLVIGPYRVLAPIGKGGMSTVYLARDSRLLPTDSSSGSSAASQLLALKVLPPKQAREETRHRARFLREMELSQKVEHPHIARTYEVGVSEGVYFIAMEFIPGRSLRRLVAEEGPLPIPRAARLFAETAEALQHAHDRGVIHRDLKPSNIMVARSGHAKLLDLGLALIEGEIATDHTVVGGQGYVVGTMDYIAPEQSEDATKVCPRSDIYGLGCALYFALTGRPPFPGGSAWQKIMRHRTEQPPPVEKLNPTVPPAFALLLRTMMAKRPEDRFASADDVRTALLPWADSTAWPTEADAKSDSTATLVRAIEADYAESDSDESIIPSPTPDDTGSSPAIWPTYVAPIAIGGIVGLVLVGLFFLLTS
jgi:serine/threonine protein kinase